MRAPLELTIVYFLLTIGVDNLAGAASYGEAGPLAKQALRQFLFDEIKMKGIICQEIAGNLGRKSIKLN